MTGCLVSAFRSSRPAGWIVLFLLGVGACLVLLPWPYSDDDICHHLIARDALRRVVPIPSP